MNLLAIRTSNSNEKNILCSRHFSYEIINISKTNNNHNNKIFTHSLWFLDLDRSLNRKRERFEIFKVGLRSNCDNFIINLIII